MYSLRFALCGFQRAGALYNSILAAFWKGDDGGGDTPLPIPNREVKPASADGTAGETPWESRSSPIFCCPRNGIWLSESLRLG
jgi:hypothetical protein